MANSVFDELFDALKVEIGESIACDVIACIVKTCGGERVYVPMKFEIEKKVLPTDTPKTVQQKLGCSKRTAYRKLGRFRI